MTEPTLEDRQNRRWQVWATILVVAFALLAIVIGFFVISSRGEDGVAAAAGIVHRHADDTDAPVVIAPPPTNVAWTSETLALVAAGDVDAGRTLATQSCAACHGETGVAPSPAFPNLAGQVPAALYKQLRDYADGNRLSLMMGGIAAGLDDRQMADLAAYFAAQEPAPVAPAETADDIRDILADGDPARGLPSCNSCHGPRGAPQGIPTLEGQNAQYLQMQLEAFAGGERGNDIYGVMREVARMLTEREIAELADFYGD